MPRKLRSSKIHRNVLTDGQIDHLCTGRDFFGDGFGRENPDEEAMRQAWNDHADEIERVNAESWPGTVPYARSRFAEGLSHEAALAATWPAKPKR